MVNVKRELNLRKTIEFTAQYKTELRHRAWMQTVNGWDTLTKFILKVQYPFSTEKWLLSSITTNSAGKLVFQTVNKHASRICITLSASGSLIGLIRVISSNLNSRLILQLQQNSSLTVLVSKVGIFTFCCSWGGYF